MQGPGPPDRRTPSLGIWLRHRRSARQTGLDRAPDPSLCRAPAARGSSARLLRGDSSRRDQDPRTCRENSLHATFPRPSAHSSNGQDAALSRLKYGFDSRMGYQTVAPVREAPRATTTCPERGSARAESWWAWIGRKFESASKYEETGQMASCHRPSFESSGHRRFRPSDRGGCPPGTAPRPKSEFACGRRN